MNFIGAKGGDYILIVISSTFEIVVDSNGLKFYNSEFYPESISLSFKEFGEDKRKKINLGTIKCPSCSSLDTNEYFDCFFCFNCKYKEKYFFSSDRYVLIDDDGYLSKRDRFNKKVFFFHRELMKDSINKRAKMERIPPSELEIHHFNEDTRDNRISNLKVMTIKEHRAEHRQRYKEKAYDTWCDKTGNYDYDLFEEWLEKKEDEYDG